MSLFTFALVATRPPDEILLINNASTDETAEVARAIPGICVIDEPVKGLVVARERARREAFGDVLVYVDADCRAPIFWLERIERRLESRPASVAITGPYKFYDWDFMGRALIRSYDCLVAPPTHLLVHYGFGLGAVLYGGNFAVRREALARIGGFDRTVEFHGEDTNLGRRLTPIGTVELANDCWVWTSARRYPRDGQAEGLWSLYSKLLVGDPAASSRRLRSP